MCISHVLHVITGMSMHAKIMCNSAHAKFEVSHMVNMQAHACTHICVCVCVCVCVRAYVCVCVKFRLSCAVVF